MSTPQEAVTLEYKGRIALITLNRESKLNALNQDLYYHLATLLNDIAKRNDIFITVLTGKGRFFSA
jgi:Delta3-Delta2-enoyl-CoA isomerase